MSRPRASDAPALRRVVVLGASNVSRGVSVIAETARRVWGRPLELFLAHGHGRSYAHSSRVIVRRLPGILECGLWDALERRPELPTAALVTDIGNDLMYESTPDEVAAWVDEVLGRLARRGATIIVTRLPIGNLPGVSERKFRLMRKLFFPNCRLGVEELSGRACELDRRVVELAARHGAQLAEQRSSWYGIDPLHITFRQMSVAWREIMSPWLGRQEWPPAAPRSALRALYLRSVFPERRELFGFEQRAVQPSRRLPDGSTVWAY